jgi:hypothetical protein
MYAQVTALMRTELETMLARTMGHMSANQRKGHGPRYRSQSMAGEGAASPH